MIWGMILFTLISLLVSVQQFRYWSRLGKRGEARLFLLWMVVAWGLGMLFFGGMHMPLPKKPLFQGW